MRTRRGAASAACWQRFNTWFDHQADRYGSVIAWALHHRVKMFLLAIASFVGAIALHVSFGGSSFLPLSDAGVVVIDVRTPSSSSLNYRKLKVEAAATLARTIPETVATNTVVNPTGGRVYVDIGKSTKRARSAEIIARDLRGLTVRLVGAEYTVLEDLNTGVQKPVQVRFNGADSRKLLELTNDFMAKLRQVPGAVDVGLSEQDPQAELKIELDRGLANALGISVADAAQALRVAFAGIEVGDWVDPTGETRDVAVRLHPDDRVDASNIERLPIAVTGGNRIVPLEQIATVTMGKGPSQIQHAEGRRTISVSANAQGRSPGEVTADALRLARSMDFPPGYGIELAGASRDQEEVFSRMGIALISGVGADVLDPGDPVRLVHRAAAGDAVVAAVADRRGDRAAADARHAQPDELHRRDHVVRAGGQERDPAARCGTHAGAPGHGPRRGADAGRPQALPSDPDDHVCAHRRHDAGGRGHRRGRRVLPADGGGHHRRHDHLDLA